MSDQEHGSRYTLDALRVGLAKEKSGGRIPGSSLVRFFCDGCHAPVRIKRETFIRRIESGLDGGDNPVVPIDCEECSGAKRNLMPAGKAGPLDPDAGGYSDIAKRELEGGR